MEKTEQADIYFIASARCHQVKYVSGSIITPDDREVWLGEEDGYRSTCLLKEDARHFKNYRDVIDLWTYWDGLPWYHRFKQGSLRIFRITTITKIEKNEIEVTPL